MNPLSLILSIPGVLGGNSPFPKRDPGMSIDSTYDNTTDSGNTSDTSTVMKSGSKGKGGINYGTGLYDPEQSSRILENMQAFKNQREGSSGNMMSPLDQHLQAAIAYGTGNPEDILNIQKQSQLNAKEAFDMQMQIEQFKAGQAQQAAFNKMKDKFLSGAIAPSGAEGSTNLGGISNIYTLPTEIKNALAGAQTKAEWDKIYNDYAKDVNAERAKNFYSIEWDKPVAVGIGNDVRIMTLRAAQDFISGNRGKVTSIKDPSTGQSIDPSNGKPVSSGLPPTGNPNPNKAPAKKNDIDPSLVPKARSVYKEGGHVKKFADGSTTGELTMADIPAQSDSVFADVAPTLVADASNTTPQIPVTAKYIPQASDFPLAPEQVHKTRDIKNTIETTGGQEREKEDALDIKDLEAREKQAINTLDDVERYKKYLDKKPHLFGPIKSNPILNNIVPWLEAIPGIKNPENEKSHGLDLRQALINAEITDPNDIGDRDNASSLATQLGIAYAKLNFPGRMTNMELGQQQKAKGLSVDDTAQSNQRATNLIEHEAKKTLGLADSWKRFKIQEENMKPPRRPTWSNFQLTDAYDKWKHLSPPPEAVGRNEQKSFITNNNHVVEKKGD